MPIISGGGTGGGGLTAAFKSVVSGSSTTVVDTGANGIPITGNVLYIYFNAVDTGGAGNPGLTFNNDSGANYDEQASFVNNGATSFLANFATTSCDIYVQSATYSTSGVIVIPNYANTTFNKTGTKQIIRGNTATGTAYTITGMVGYRSTSAISRCAFTSNGTNWAAGSLFAVYVL